MKIVHNTTLSKDFLWQTLRKESTEIILQFTNNKSEYKILFTDVIISRGNLLLTGSEGKNVRVWSVVGVGEMRLPGETYNVRTGGLTMEDEMNVDGAVVSAAFDEAMDMVRQPLIYIKISLSEL